MKSLIIAAAKISLGVLHQLLEEVGVQEWSVLGNHVGDGAIETQDPDLVVGILSPDAQGVRPNSDSSGDSAKVAGFTNLDVMLRIGRFVERGNQTLLIVPPPLSLPAPAAGLSVAPCRLDDRASLELHLWAAAAGAGNARPVVIRPSQIMDAPQRSNRSTDQIIRLLKALSRDGGSRSSVSGLRIEEMILQLLRDSAAEVAENPARTGPDAGFDAALIPEKGSSKVFLVEIMTGDLQGSRLIDRARRLQSTVLERGSDLGILVYQDRLSRRFEPGFVPIVITIAAEDLVERLGETSLARIIDQEVAAAARRM